MPSFSAEWRYINFTEFISIGWKGTEDKKDGLRFQDLPGCFVKLCSFEFHAKRMLGLNGKLCSLLIAV